MCVYDVGYFGHFSFIFVGVLLLILVCWVFVFKRYGAVHFKRELRAELEYGFVAGRKLSGN